MLTFGDAAIKELLRVTQGNRSKAAEIPGISRRI